MSDISKNNFPGIATNNNRGMVTILSSDVPNLPIDEYLSGTIAYCVDTGDVYMYYEATKQWYLQ